MSGFLMTLRPFFFFGAPSPAGCTAPGASPAGRKPGLAPGGATALRRSIFPRTFTPRISSKPGGGGAPGTAGATGAGLGDDAAAAAAGARTRGAAGGAG